MDKQVDKQEVLRLLQQAAGENADTVKAHLDADAALLAYIGDPQVTAAYKAVAKWYA